MIAGIDRASSARLVRPLLSIAVGTAVFQLLFGAVAPLIMPALAVTIGLPWMLAAELLLALLAFPVWIGAARHRGGAPSVVAGGLLLALALIGFVAVLRGPLLPGDDPLVPGAFWVIAVVAAAGLTLGGHLRLLSLTGPGALAAVLATGATLLVGPLLANLAFWLLWPAAAAPAVPAGPVLAWAAIALLLSVAVLRQKPEEPQVPAQGRGDPSEIMLGALGLFLLMIPLTWLSAVRPPLMLQTGAADGPALLTQAILVGYLLIAGLLALAAWQRGPVTLVAALLAGIIAAAVLYPLGAPATPSLAWVVSIDVATALATVAGFFVLLGTRASPVRVAVAWTAIQAATTVGSRGGVLWWQVEGYVVTGPMRDVGTALALAGALVLFGIVLFRRTRARRTA